jgi:putative flippase GtrA
MTQISTIEGETVAQPTQRQFRTPLDRRIGTLAERFGGEKAKELERFLKFALVGLTGAFIDLGILTLLQLTILPPAAYIVNPIDFNLGALPVDFELLTIPLDINVAMATTIAFVCAVVSNFTWTSLWVYPESTSRSMRRQLTQFFIISVIGWSARTLWITTTYVTIGTLLAPTLEPVMRILDAGFEFTPVGEKRLGSIIAQLVAMVFVMLWNFFANRYWTFNDVD